MRTTLAIDDDVLAAARSLARSEGKPLGVVLSGLARKGLEPRREHRRKGHFPTFSIRANAPPLTMEMVRKARDDE